MIEPDEFLNFSEVTPTHFFQEVIAGLTHKPKVLPGKYFYDDEGAYLFERICETQEYYLTRTELAILREHAAEMAQLIGEKALLIEYGSGNSEKTEILLNHLKAVSAYVPVDLSQEYLNRIVESFAKSFPYLDILPICGDLSSPLKIPQTQKYFSKRVIYLPGSTLGHFPRLSAAVLLRRMAEFCFPGDGFLIGIDFKKDPERLSQAYNDREGYTESFNLNILRRINRELNANFQLQNFRHRAFYNKNKGRIEMHLVSLKEQTIRIRNIKIPFKMGETIHSESVYKFDLSGFKKITQFANLQCVKIWTDVSQLFGMVYLTLMAPCSKEETPSSPPLKTGPVTNNPQAGKLRSFED